jgi:hypothetical protein
MKNDRTLKESISTLADMTRESMEKSLQIENINDVNAHYSPRHGWHLKRYNVEETKVWQDDFK